MKTTTMKKSARAERQYNMTFYDKWYFAPLLAVVGLLIFPAILGGMSIGAGAATLLVAPSRQAKAHPRRSVALVAAVVAVILGVIDVTLVIVGSNWK